MTPSHRWQFWIDRGGTFTDIVARQPDGQFRVHKLLSENPDRYVDAPLQGMRDLLGIDATEPLPTEQIEAIKMGTTVATNALLERQGDRTVLLITQGFGDALRIGYQHRPNIFARQIVLPEMLYERVIEVAERVSAQGQVLTPLSATEQLRQALQEAYTAGIDSCAIVLMHGYRYPSHEQQLVELAREIGFSQISASHWVSPLMKLVSRGDTTVVDAYLSPILRRYVDRITQELAPVDAAATVSPPRLLFMQSNGGLTEADLFQGKDSILSGPAGGIVGAVQTSRAAGYRHIIGFDMGGTSTDVSHFNGEYERTLETEVAGVRLRAPMMAIHTVAAGGGSILHFDGARYRVGPASAGADPGPACYRRGGPLTVTDANVMVGKLQPDFFPRVFGPAGDQPIDATVVQARFAGLAADICQATGDRRSPEQVAAGFLAIAVDKMANAIKKISVQRGYDVSEYVLCCFGSAGGQHACLIAEALGIPEILIHPYAGVLSAYGMGLADQRCLGEGSVERPLSTALLPELTRQLSELASQGKAEMQQQGFTLPAGLAPLASTTTVQVACSVHLRYEGTDAALVVPFAGADTMRASFETLHQQRYGFMLPDKALIVESVAAEVIGRTEAAPVLQESPVERTDGDGLLVPKTTVPLYTRDAWRDTPVFLRQELAPGDIVVGPALIIEPTGTNVIEPGWQARCCDRNLILRRTPDASAHSPSPEYEQVYPGADAFSPAPEQPAAAPDPVMLEIFNNLFRAIAEEMGITLQNTSYSVNIKERLDFSCAIFDQQGQLVANAPHIPVHLGSMGESVQSLIRARGGTLNPGDVYMMNNPYDGGTHLPDVTVITPVFWTPGSLGERAGEDRQDGEGATTPLPAPSAPPPARPLTPLFYVASRGHHADIGGISPGSMPPHSTTIAEEGVLIDHFRLVDQGAFQEAALLALLTGGPYPARNPGQNIADLQAQIAANEKGVQELQRMVRHYGLPTVQAYMQHVQDNAEACVRDAIATLCGANPRLERQFTYPMDGGTQIQVNINLDAASRSACIDFTGTSPQQPNNFNAPTAVCKAAVLYVFRTLVDDDIPLNAGCLKPLKMIIPAGSLLNPQPPAAVVAGNVETSQAVTDALYGALGILAAAQGTMNNLTFGNGRYQYYETLCGGAGAGPGFDGADAVHTHMTNSRLTDPEVLEWRFPVLLEQFSIRPDSGGSGQYRGGNGIIRRIQFREPMTAAILSSHRRVPPFGLAGGAPGQVGRNWVERQDGTVEALDVQATVEMEAGDVLVIETPGGGGYGSAAGASAP
jgi:5-oxoprolinase (ATP-hydrolysing)